MRQISALGLALIGIFALLCIGGVGALCSLAIAPALNEEADKIAELPTTPDVQTGEKAALTGDLSGNTLITSDPDIPNIAAYKVVAYRIEKYTTSTSGSGSKRRTTHSWKTYKTVINTLKLDVDGTAVSFYASDGIDISGDMHNFQEQTVLTSGDLRVVGFRDGDRVTIVGKRMGDEFMAEKLHGGTRGDLVSDTRTAAKVFRYLGFGTMACGGLVAVGLIGTAILLVWRKKPDPVVPGGPSMWPPMPPPDQSQFS